MDYSITDLQERLGTEATADDAVAALERAEAWYNRTAKPAVLAWYEAYRLDNPNAADITDPDDERQLVDDWATVVMFHRAASLADLPA